jgi:phosphatidylinositol 3-kinase
MFSFVKQVLYICEVFALILLSQRTLEGKRQKPEYDRLLSNPMLKFSGLYQDGFADLVVVCQVFSDGRPLALPVSTSYKAFTTRWK